MQLFFNVSKVFFVGELIKAAGVIELCNFIAFNKIFNFIFGNLYIV